jgi:NADPH:quinone reductase-like Zn-dependent oxidoreductase
MQAFAVDEFGQTGRVRELDDPQPGEGQVRIRVSASGLNPFDASVLRGYLKERMEHHFPLVLGMDGSGTIDAVGPGVEGLAVGDDVFGSVGKSTLGEGTLAELATMSTGTIARRPASLGREEAAALPVAGVTALVMVEAIAPSEGDVLVVLGGTGGVGGYLVQLAARRGARVVAVCRGENADYARSLGAAEVIDYTSGDVAEAVRTRYPDGIHGVADLHGDREQVAAVAELVREGGHVSSATGAADVDTLGARGLGATNVYGRVTTEDLEQLTSMLERGEIRSPEIHPFKLAEAGDALSTVGSGHVRGKLVVVPR